MGSQTAEEEVSWREDDLLTKSRTEKPGSLFQHFVPCSSENAGETCSHVMTQVQDDASGPLELKLFAGQ